MIDGEDPCSTCDFPTCRGCSFFDPCSSCYDSDCRNCCYLED